MDADDQPCVRLFLSADLVGSTEFKQKPNAQWIDVFTEFYKGFPTFFQRKLDNVSLPPNLCPRIVKSIGDELFMQVKIEGSEDARTVIRFFTKVLKDYKKNGLGEFSLHIKGTAWIAGFPLNNRRVAFPFKTNTPSPDGEARKIPEIEDFIGPSIDTGFRLCRFSTPTKLVVSVDLALLLLRDDEHPFQLHFGGVEPLKGVLDGRRYPVIWHPVAHAVTGKDAELEQLELDASQHHPEPKVLEKYCKKYVAECMAERTWLFPPYFKSDPDFTSMPPWHEPALELNEELDRRNFYADGVPADAPPGQPPVLEDPPPGDPPATA